MAAEGEKYIRDVVKPEMDRLDPETKEELETLR